MTLCGITRKAKNWKTILTGFKIAKRELTDESKSVSSLFINHGEMLPNRCRRGAKSLKSQRYQAFPVRSDYSHSTVAGGLDVIS